MFYGNTLGMKKVGFVLVLIIILGSSILVGCDNSLNEYEVKLSLWYDKNDFNSEMAYNLVFDGVKKLVFIKMGEVSAEEVEGVAQDILLTIGDFSAIKANIKGNEVAIFIGDNVNYRKEGVVTIPLNNIELAK